jgi:hypothetical protein
MKAKYGTKMKSNFKKIVEIAETLPKTKNGLITRPIGNLFRKRAVRKTPILCKELRNNYLN